MDITVKVNLDNYYPCEIIELHKKGYITLTEIIASKPHERIGYELREYVHNCLTSQKERYIDSLGKTKVL